jgi:hypothetical protein
MSALRFGRRKKLWIVCLNTLYFIHFAQTYRTYTMTTCAIQGYRKEAHPKLYNAYKGLFLIHVVHYCIFSAIFVKDTYEKLKKENILLTLNSIG